MLADNSNKLFIQMLEVALQNRKMRNPLYSQRALARDLGINQADLSQILKSKKQMSKKAALRIIESLEWTEEEKKMFIESFLWSWWNKGA